MNCLDENTVLAFVDGRLAPDARGEIERHLATCGACVDLVSLAGSRTEFDGYAVHADIPLYAPPSRGSTIGRYVILGLIGRGGMGEVYAAYDPELDRRIALKLLNETGQVDDSTGKARARLLREAKVIAKLSHPNVVVVHDAGTIDDRVFIAMEFVHGKTLSEWLTLTPRSWPEIRAVFLAAGRGLAAAHAAGLVHRDFKPQNVMVGEDGTVRVMDFGLASQVLVRNEIDGDGTSVAAQDTPGTQPLTRTGTLLGTPIYMAPEHLLVQKADERSDQFSFCVALYEAVYGERPFPSESLLSLRAAVALGKIRDPPPRNRVPAWLRKVIIRGLSVNPAARFPSMVELLAALQRDPAKTRRRILVGSLGAALLLGGGAVAQKTATRAGDALCQNAHERTAAIWNATIKSKVGSAFRATGKPYAGDALSGVTGTLDDYIRRWTGMYVETCEATHVRGDQSAEVLDLRMTCLGDRLEEVSALARVLTNANETTVERAVSAAAGLHRLDPCADVRALRSGVQPPKDPNLRKQVDALRPELVRVRTLHETGAWSEASAASDRLVAQARKVGYAPLVGQALAVSGLVCIELAKISEAEQALEEAVFVAEASRDDQTLAEACANLVFVTGYLHGKHEVAEMWARRAESVLGRIGDNRLLRGWLLNNLAVVRSAQGRLGEAVANLEESIALKTAVLGPKHFDVARSRSNLAVDLHKVGRINEALAAGNGAHSVFTVALGQEHPWVAWNLGSRAEILLALGRVPEARADVERGLAIARKAAHPNVPGIADLLTTLAICEIGEGSLEAAITLLQQSVHVFQNNRGPPELEGRALFELGKALWLRGKDQMRAIHFAAQARDLYRRFGLGKEAKETDLWLSTHRMPSR